MRILHVSTRLILGGSQENTMLSCEGQARRGHDVHLAFGPIYGPEGSLLERVQNFRTADGRGITTHVVPHLVREVNPIADLKARYELGQLLNELRPKVVHTHSSKAGILGRCAAWKWARSYRLSVGPDFVNHRGTWPPFEMCGIVHTIHGPPFMPIEGSLAQRAKIGFNNWLYTRAEKYAAKRCHTIVSVADAMTNQFLARGIGKPAQYVTVRSGMEIEPFLAPRPGESRDEMREQLGLLSNDFVIGTVARLAQHKGHDDLLDALKDADDPRLVLLWVGDGWWKDRLIRRALKLGYQVRECRLDPVKEHVTHVLGGSQSSRARIVLTGLVPPERIPALIRAMDILAHPSYREGLPRTVPQALLSNVCPVANDVDGTGEICRDMQTGRLVPLGDVAKLRDAILWLRDHPAERAAMAARGREECRIAFSAETMVNRLEEVYAKALKLAGVDELKTK